MNEKKDPASSYQTKQPLSKGERDLKSVKVWVLILATVLLLTRYIGAKHWVSVLVGVVAAREYSSFDYRRTRVKDDED